MDGERSSVKTTHPLLTDPAVRQALSLLVDRAAVQEQIYGRQGQTTANYLNAPSRFFSRNTRWEFNVDRASQILDAAGWKRGADGVRAKDGRKLKMVFQTSINAPRQKTQQIVKQAATKAGIDLELKSVVASVFFSSDPANPDTYSHFSADLQMYNAETASTPSPACESSRRGRPRRRTTSGRAGTSPAGATRSTTGMYRPPRPRWTRSSAPRCSSR